MIISPSIRAASVQEYFFSGKMAQIRQMIADGIPVLNLGIGNPDLPPSEKTIDRLVATSSQYSTHGYQAYRGIPELRNALAQWYRKYFKAELKPADEILPLIGSKEGIMHISLAFVNRGDGVLIPDPGYPTYESVSKIAGAKIFKYNLLKKNNWLPDFSEIEKHDLSEVKIMWMNYPNMPTGAVADDSFFKQSIEFALKHKILLINDNPYSFILNEDYKSILAYTDAKKCSLELNSVSKAHNMAGWRVGAVLGRADYIATILKIKSNMDSGMFLPVQYAAAEALKADDSWYKSNNQIYEKRRTFAEKILDALNCKYSKNSQGMFIWAEIPGKFKNGFELSNLILKKTNVFITPGGVFGQNGEQYIRISLCASENMLKEALERIKISKI